MLGRKFYKTKLCKLYQGGRCPRQNCSFAHGNAELRHAPGPFNDVKYALVLSVREYAQNHQGGSTTFHYCISLIASGDGKLDKNYGLSSHHLGFDYESRKISLPLLEHFPSALLADRRDYRSGDLRDKLERRHSPHRRYSPGRDARGYRAFHGQKPASHDRGYSVSKSPVKRSEKRHRKKQLSDGESDDSGSYKISSGTEDRRKEDKNLSSDEKDVLEDQLKKMQLEIEMLDDHKSQLETLLEEKDDEACKFSNRIKDLEMQLNKEQEDCKRITLKIRKFIRAHGRYLKAQEELKRSQARLQKLGDQLGSDTSKSNANEEDSSVNLASDELQNNSSMKKRQHAYTATSEEAQIGNLQKRKIISGMISRSEKLTRVEGPLLFDNDNKDTEAKKLVHTKKDVHKSLADGYKYKRGKLSSPNVASLDKVKGSEMGRPLPSTSMAAHAVDELIEAIEMEDKSEGKEVTEIDETGAAGNRAGLSYMPPPPPPPPVAENAYKQYEGDDEDVDVEKVDAEMVDIDLNSEVEIEQL